MNRRLLVDLSSICWTCLLAGKDKEFGKQVMFKDKPVMVNSANYGYENAINHFTSTLRELELTPKDMILVVEGLNSKLLRQSTMPSYKGGSEPTRPEEAYTEFNDLKNRLTETFLSLGASVCWQDGIEADDVLAYLALNLKGVRIIDTNDGDMAKLIQDDGSIQLWRFGKGLVVDNPFGPFPCRYITVYKALVGDPSDHIPGAKGFGTTAWNNLLVQFGYDGLELMEGLLEKRKLDTLVEDVGQLKALQTIIDNKEMVYKSYDCAKLYPNMVNTMRKPLQWKAGMVKSIKQHKDERLRQYAQQTRLVSAENFDAALKFFASKVEESPIISFDIETSSNDTADQWLEAAKAKSTAEGDDIGVDVFGAILTSFSVTFGSNNQYTYYVTIDHVEEAGVTNITREQAKAMLRAIPHHKKIIIQNVAFELTVVWNNLGSMEEEGVPQ